MHISKTDLQTVKVMSQLFGPYLCDFLLFLTIRFKKQNNVVRFSKTPSNKTGQKHFVTALLKLLPLCRKSLV